MKPLLLQAGALAAAVLTAASIAGAQQNDQSPPAQRNFDQQLRELDIMANIFAATLREDSGGDRRGLAPAPRALYLAGQGMVFTFDINSPWLSSRGGSYWQQLGTDMSRLASEITAELAASFPDLELGFLGGAPLPPAPRPAPGGIAGLTPGTDSAGSDAWREARREQQEALRDMTEAMRDRQRAIQQLQRDLRDLRRDLLRGAGEERARAEREIAELESSIAEERSALERQRTGYEQYVAELQARRAEQLTAYSEQLADRAIGTLCDYGVTLRSLPPAEHVTLIFENFAEDGAQAYVFESADITACESATSLKAQAVSYRM